VFLLNYTALYIRDFHTELSELNVYSLMLTYLSGVIPVSLKGQRQVCKETVPASSSNCCSVTFSSVKYGGNQSTLCTFHPIWPDTTAE